VGRKVRFTGWLVEGFGVGFVEGFLDVGLMVGCLDVCKS
jgi:hypothetical protein